MQNPTVSIIIPIYNSAKYLKPCLDSVLAQTHPNLDIILIDDGSTDNSGKLIEQYAKKDHRITTLHQPNQGQSVARNNGLKIATGEYLCFVDSDDEIAPDFIRKLLAPYLKNPQNSSSPATPKSHASPKNPQKTTNPNPEHPQTTLTICGFKRLFLDSGKSEFLYLSPILKKSPRESAQTYILKLLTRDGRLYSSVNKLYKSDIAQQCAFDPSLNFAEDTKFVLDYLKTAILNNSTDSANITFIPEPLYIYNFGTETSTINSSSLIWQNWQTSYENLKSWLGPHPTFEQKNLLKLVHLRWRLSYLRSKHRAKQ